MNRRELFASTVALCGSAIIGEARAAGPLVVIVHGSVTQGSFSQGELSAIFTTRRRNYDGGQRVIPLNLPPGDEGRVTFDEKVLGMSPDEIARYWIDRKVRGGNAPPRHVPSAALIARLVEKLPGAIGYVPASMAGSLRVVARV
jgi:ABC-type phosphate transport system substrate-binding protein